jgi:hypothetical protein
MLKSSSRKKKATAVVAQLIDMSLAELRAEWQRRYGPPPKHRASDLLRRVLAWRIQADAFGDLDAATRRILSKEQNVLRPSAQPGMRLAREWAGRLYEVVVIESGVVFEGQTFGSLSEVARHITGRRWNGPRFFGLRGVNVR